MIISERKYDRMKTRKKFVSISLVLVLMLSGLIVIAPASSADSKGNSKSIDNKIQADTGIIETVDANLERLLSEFDQDPDLEVLEDVQSELKSIKKTAQKIVYNVEPYLRSPDNQELPGNAFDNINFGKLTQGTVGQLHAINMQLSNTERSLDNILMYTLATEDEAEDEIQSLLGGIHTDAMYLQNTAQSVLDLIREAGLSMACTFHSPIEIYSNADFTAANGVIWGSGTSTDPYIIGGWNIDASTGIGIDIRNTDAHFIIRDVCVHSGIMGSLFPHDGISIWDASNGTIETSTLWENRWGISLFNDRDMRIKDNTISKNGETGIFLMDSQNTEIVNNDIFENEINGIGLVQSDQIVISENELHENEEYGIFIYESFDVTIEYNAVAENGKSGIGIGDSNNITISHNDVIENDESGIWITSSHEIRAIDNRVNSNDEVGISISDGSSNIQIDGNIVSNNDFSSLDGYGVSITSASNVEIIDNLIFSNKGAGVGLLKGSSNVRIMRNAILNNKGDFSMATGIHVIFGSIIMIGCNDIRDHTPTMNAFGGLGIYLGFGSNSVTVFHNNFVNNSAFDDGSGNNWDISYPSGGNYWSDYGGSDSQKGPLQNRPGRDGIGDTPYPILLDKTDRYPLMEPCRNSFWNLFWIPSQQLTTKVSKQLISNQGTLEKLGERLESIFETSDNIYDDATIVALISMQENANSISAQITEKLGDNPPPPNLNPSRGTEIPNKAATANKIAANTKILIQVDSRLEGILDNINGEPDKSTAAALSAMRDAADSIVNRITEILDDFPVPPPPKD
jgi:parallel beta-helix repeat protein